MEWLNDSISVSVEEEEEEEEEEDNECRSPTPASVSVFDALSVSGSSASASGFGDSSVFSWLAECTPDASAELAPSPSAVPLPAPPAAGALEDAARTAFWEVSSAKPGFGADRLRDSSTDAYWQSDGTGPHTITVHFRSRTLVTVCALTGLP